MFDLNIVSWWVPAIGALAVVPVCCCSLVASVVSCSSRAGCSACCLALLAIGAGVNVHFDYFRTIGEVFGQVPGGVSAAEVRAQERKGVPDRDSSSHRTFPAEVRVRCA